jgi:hypothetical protein
LQKNACFKLSLWFDSILLERISLRIEWIQLTYLQCVPTVSYALDGKKIRSHAAQEPTKALFFNSVALPLFYQLSIIIPRQNFIKGYPVTEIHRKMTVSDHPVVSAKYSTTSLHISTTETALVWSPPLSNRPPQLFPVTPPITLKSSPFRGDKRAVEMEFNLLKLLQWWAVRGLNPRLPPCEDGTLPLS